MRGFNLRPTVVTVLSFFACHAICDISGYASTIETTNITFTGTASGGVLILADTLNRNTRWVSVETEPGESAVSVAGRLATVINETNPFEWQGGGPHGVVSAVGSSLQDLPGPLGSYVIAGTERGLGITEPPRSLTCVYEKAENQVRLRWQNPRSGYDRIVVVLNWTNYDHSGSVRCAGTLTSYVLDLTKHPMDVNDLDVWVIGYRNNVPSNAAAIHLSQNSQEELYGIPFTDNVAPNWTAWNTGGGNTRSLRVQGVRAEYASRPRAFNPIRDPSTKPFFQTLKASSPTVSGGVWRKFLGLTPGHTYRISARLNTFGMNAAQGQWSFSLHAAHNNPEGADLTVEQLSGLAPLPNGSQGRAAARIASYGPGTITGGKWVLRSTDDGGPDNQIKDITLPPGMHTITVWVRHSGDQTTGVGVDWLRIEDILK